MGDYNKKSLLFFIALLFWYSLVIIIDFNAWMFKDSSLYTLLSVILFYIWLFFIITYFVILFDTRKAFFKVMLFLIISTAFIIFASQYIWIYFLLLTLLLLIFKRAVFKNIFTILSIIFILSASFYYTMLYTGLASDEEMIEHFKEHKAEFEEIVKRYREFDAERAESDSVWSRSNETGELELTPYISHSLWNKQSNTPELLQKISIDTINIHSKIPALVDSVTIWLPNPYSEKTVELAEKMINASQKINDWLSEKKPVEYQYGALVISLKPRAKYLRDTFSFEYVHKDIYFIPEIPLIENGELIDPANIKGEHPLKRSVASSLNYIPLKWYFPNKIKNFSCVLRQIEPQWFLRMCATECSKIEGGKGCIISF